LDDRGGGVVATGGGVVAECDGGVDPTDVGGATAVGDGVTGEPDPAAAELVVRFTNVAGDAAGAPGATAWLTTEPAPPPEPVVSAPPEDVPPDEAGVWGVAATGLPPRAPEPVAAPA
jgi:hypothetical protein